MISVKSEKTAFGTSLYWISDSVGDICVNQNGVKSLHTTTVVQGSGILRMKSGELKLQSGDVITIPINTPYEVEVTELVNGTGIIRCDYSRANEAEIKHLESVSPKNFQTLRVSVISPSGREVQESPDPLEVNDVLSVSEIED